MEVMHVRLRNGTASYNFGAHLSGSRTELKMSTLIRNSSPASLRKPAQSVRLNSGLAGTLKQAISSLDTRTSASVKTRFAALPQEPEDAGITGMTRSLSRRLLALNIQGSLTQLRAGTSSRIA